MIICDDPAFIFIHIPKTAGTSISSLFPEGNKHRYCLSHTKHETVADLVRRIGFDQFKRYLSFAVVRHPLQRFVSHFSYLKSNPEQFPELDPINTLDEYVDSILSNDVNIIRKRERVMPQYMYLALENDSIVVDKIVKYECIDLDLSSVFSKLGLPFNALPRLNVSTLKKPEANKRVVDFVENYYKKDFELFGYRYS